MKRIFIAFYTLTIVTGFILILNLLFSSKLKTEAKDFKSDIEIIAHRGFEDTFPENTIYAAKKAVALGTSPEFDIQFTYDGEMVVIHDISVDRTTNGTGIVSKLNYSYIKSLDAGEKFSKDYKNLVVPKFSDYLDAVKDAKHIYPELKTYRNNDDIGLFAEMLIEKGFEDKATILSFNYLKTLPYIRSKSKRIIVGALCKDTTTLNKSIRVAKRDKHSIIVIPIELANSNTLYTCMTNHLDVAVWTIHDVNTFKRLKSIGYRKFICSTFIDVAYEN